MSKFLASIIIVAAVSVILPVVFTLFYFLKAREGKKQKIKQGEVFRTRAPTAIKAFFLGFTIVMLAAMVAIDIDSIVAGDSLSTIVIITGYFALGFLVGMFGFFVAALNYEIVDGDKIIVVRCFKKRREVEISSIACYQNTGGYISLTAFDQNDIPLFSSSGFNLNLDGLMRIFDSHSIPQEGKDYPTKETKATPIYKRYIKKHNLTVFSWIFFGLGFVTLYLSALIFPTSLDNYEFENYEASGVISEYELKTEFVTFKLEGDENIYYINNIVYKELKTSFKKDVKIGERVSLLIGYTDGRGRSNVFQFEMNGVIYLDNDSAQRAESENDNLGYILCWVFFGISAALLIAWLPCLICANKIKVYE